jgi:peptide/nickel transport system substrate-binding protein
MTIRPSVEWTRFSRLAAAGCLACATFLAARMGASGPSLPHAPILTPTLAPIVAPVLALGLAPILAPGLAPAHEPASSELLQAQATAADPARAATVVGPDGRVPADFFHPDNQPGKDGRRPPPPEPAYGGRVIVQLETMPGSLCAVIENLASARRVLYEVHETLLLRDWDTGELKPDLCRRFDVEDTLVLKGGRGQDNANIRVGRFQETSDTFKFLRDVGYGTDEVREYPKADVERLERSTVFTFHLRDDVRWHDGHPFDARDVVFSAELYKNKFVDCDEKRFQFDKIVKVEAPDPHTVRILYERQYYQALPTIGDLCILPSHLYNLSDPEHERFDPDYYARKRAEHADWKPSDEEQGEYVNTNPHNRDWVGLGPYKVVKWDADSIETERFEGYFDRARAGYLDAIRWRHVPSDDLAFQALLNDELDVFTRMSAADYFGEATRKPLFTDHYYKGHVYANAYWYTAWNLDRAKFSDTRVREALAHAFDFDEFKRTMYMGLAEQVTGQPNSLPDGYDRNLKPFAYDLDKARELLTQAGWYDRDGDGIVDKDGSPLEIELLVQAGNKVSEQFALKLQESLAHLGIKLKCVALDIGTVSARSRKREFDALALGWVLPYEIDPEQMWHSKWAGSDARGSNNSGLRDARVDALIERGQRELDPVKRAATWRELQARVYSLQPYLFGFSPPRKFAVNKKIRGVQVVKADPNFVLRRWYYPAGTPGTRATLEAKK